MNPYNWQSHNPRIGIPRSDVGPIAELGSHRRFKHPKGAKVTVSGHKGDDARVYQELDVARAIKESQR